MSQELPHASLQCSDCGTTFRVTLKKGRVPSRPIPCPKCKAPITVTEDDIEHPGQRRARTPTVPGDVLRKTRLVELDPEKLAETMKDPPTAEVALGDPPTAEVEVDEEESQPAVETPDPDAPPAFGIIQKRRIGSKSPDAELRKETPLGIEVAKPTGRGRRDNVFGDRTSNSVAIGRISTKRVTAVEQRINPDDPDLPVAPSDISSDDPDLPVPARPKTPAAEDAAAAEAPAAEESAPAEEPPKKKLDLSKLRRVMAKLKAEEEASDAAEDEASNPPDDFETGMDDQVEDLIGEASDAIETEFNLRSEASEQTEDSSPSEPEDEAELELSEPEFEPGSEPEPELDLDSEPAVAEDLAIDMAAEHSEPIAGVPNLEDSEGYELGEADIPEVPEAPKNRGRMGAIVVALVMLLVIVAIAYVVAA